jgi:hypothetical protein
MSKRACGCTDWRVCRYHTLAFDSRVPHLTLLLLKRGNTNAIIVVWSTGVARGELPWRVSPSFGTLSGNDGRHFLRQNNDKGRKTLERRPLEDMTYNHVSHE